MSAPLSVPLYVYGIAGAPVTLDDLTGVSGDPLRIVSAGGCHAIAGAMTVPPAVNADTLRAQDALVRELARRTPALLPARFGAHFADESQLRQTLDELTPRLQRALARVNGREQMTIRLFGDTDAAAGAGGPSEDAGDASASDAPARSEAASDRADESAGAAAPSSAPALGPGTQYLLRRAANARALPPVVEALLLRLAPLVEDERFERGHPPVIGSIHHLVPRGAADAYHTIVRDTRAADEFAASGIRLRVSGPSPAYAFSDTDTDLP